MVGLRLKSGVIGALTVTFSRTTWSGKENAVAPDRLCGVPMLANAKLLGPSRNSTINLGIKIGAPSCSSEEAGIRWHRLPVTPLDDETWSQPSAIFFKPLRAEQF
jgi:hypothetical protein